MKIRNFLAGSLLALGGLYGISDLALAKDPIEGASFKRFSQELLPSKTFIDEGDIKNAEAINFLQKRGIIAGYDDGSFKPQNPINRAESLKVLLEAMGAEVEEPSEDVFDDVPSGQWFSKYVHSAKEAGVIKGYDDGTFRPAQTVNQVELLKISIEAVGIDLTDYPTENLPEGVSEDVWFASYLQYALDTELLKESDIDLAGAMNREDFSVLAYNIITQQEEIIAKASGLYRCNDGTFVEDSSDCKITVIELDVKVDSPTYFACDNGDMVLSLDDCEVSIEDQTKNEEELSVGDIIYENKQNGSGASIVELESWHCEKGGFTVRAMNLSNGRHILSLRTDSLHHRAVSTQTYTPFQAEPLEWFRRKQAPNELYKVCLTDGTYAEPNETYFEIKKQNPHPWSGTSISVSGASHLPGIADLTTAGAALDLYRQKFQNNANGQVVPHACFSSACSAPSSSGSDINYDPHGGRVSIVELVNDHPDISGFDAYNIWTGNQDQWGNSYEDIEGLSAQWVTTLNNLGIINGQAVLEDIVRNGEFYYNTNGSYYGPANPSSSAGTFIFRRIESNYSYDLLPVMEADDEEPQLIIRPKTVTPASAPANSTCLSWPSCGEVDQGQRPNIYVGTGVIENTNYCPQNDPTHESYSPIVVSDSKVLVELIAEVEYLTYDQLDLVEDKGVDLYEIWEGLPDDAWRTSIAENPNKRRKEHNCVMPEPGPGQTVADMDRSDAICETKDEAYYDALIDRMIVLNPRYESRFEHPCFFPVDIEEEAVESIILPNLEVE